MVATYNFGSVYTHYVSNTFDKIVNYDLCFGVFLLQILKNDLNRES